MTQCFWLLSSLLAQLKEDGFRPSDPALFDKNITALSSALASQTTVAAGLTDFVTSKRRESYLAHASCPVAEAGVVSSSGYRFAFDSTVTFGER